MVASLPTIYDAVVTDQVYRARFGNAKRRQALAAGEDRTRAQVALTGGRGLYPSATVIAVNDEQFDPDGMFDEPASGSVVARLGRTGLIVPHTGHYLCIGSIGVNAHSLSSGVAQIWFGINGASTAFETSHRVTASAGVYLTTEGVLALGAGSLVELQGVSSGGFMALTSATLSAICVGW